MIGPDETRLLVSMVGCRIPSYSGRVVYRIRAVRPQSQVVLDSPNRQSPSNLPWDKIEQVHDAAVGGNAITPTVVDRILDNPNNRDSSTMCALILAILYPRRIIRAPP